MRTELKFEISEVQGKKIKVYSSDGTIKADKTSLNGIWQLMDYLTSDRYGANITLNQFATKVISEAKYLI